MRSRSMSVQTTSCPASARQAPVTSPTYPHPMTERRKGKPPSTEPRAFRVPLVLCAIQEKEKSPSYLQNRHRLSRFGSGAPAFSGWTGSRTCNPSCNCNASGSLPLLRATFLCRKLGPEFSRDSLRSRYMRIKFPLERTILLFPRRRGPAFSTNAGGSVRSSKLPSGSAFSTMSDFPPTLTVSLGLTVCAGLNGRSARIVHRGK